MPKSFDRQPIKAGPDPDIEMLGKRHRGLALSNLGAKHLLQSLIGHGAGFSDHTPVQPRPEAPTFSVTPKVELVPVAG
jgi:hypothetical protein